MARFPVPVQLAPVVLVALLLLPPFGTPNTADAAAAAGLFNVTLGLHMCADRFARQSEIAVRERVARFNADPSRLVNIVLRMAEAPVDPFGPAYQAIANGEYLADNGQAAAVIDASCTFVDTFDVQKVLSRYQTAHLGINTMLRSPLEAHRDTTFIGASLSLEDHVEAMRVFAQRMGWQQMLAVLLTDCQSCEDALAPLFDQGFTVVTAQTLKFEELATKPRIHFILADHAHIVGEHLVLLYRYGILRLGLVVVVMGHANTLRDVLLDTIDLGLSASERDGFLLAAATCVIHLSLDREQRLNSVATVEPDPHHRAFQEAVWDSIDPFVYPKKHQYPPAQAIIAWDAADFVVTSVNTTVAAISPLVPINPTAAPTAAPATGDKPGPSDPGSLLPLGSPTSPPPESSGNIGPGAQLFRAIRDALCDGQFDGFGGRLDCDAGRARRLRLRWAVEGLEFDPLGETLSLMRYASVSVSPEARMVEFTTRNGSSSPICTIPFGTSPTNITNVPRDARGVALKMGISLPRTDPDFVGLVSQYFEQVFLASVELLRMEMTHLDVQPVFYDVANRCAASGQAFVDREVHAVVGATRSTCSVELATVFAQHDIPIVSWSSTTPSLSNKTAFPTFFRICPSDIHQGEVLAYLSSAFGWKRVGIVATSDLFGANLARQTATVMRTLGIEPIVYPFIPVTEVAAQSGAIIDQILRDGSSVNIVSMTISSASDFLQEAVDRGLSGPGWTWVGSDGSASQGLPSFLLDRLEGMVGINPVNGLGPRYAELEAFDGEIQFQNTLRTVALRSYTAHARDAVYAIGLVANDLAEELGVDFQYMSLAQRRRKIRERIAAFDSSETGFVGASLPSVWFDKFQDGPIAYHVMNLQDGVFKPVGSALSIAEEQHIESLLPRRRTTRRGERAAAAAATAAAAAAGGSDRRRDHSTPPADSALGHLLATINTTTGFLNIYLTSDPIWADGTTSVPSHELPASRSLDGDDSNNQTAILAVAIVISLLAVLVALLLFSLVRAQRSADRQPHDFEAEYKVLGLDKKRRRPRELERENITLLEELGHGAFGRVHKAILDEYEALGLPSYLVAVKMLHNEDDVAERKALLLEAMRMVQMSHPNVLSLIGVVTAGHPTMVVLQYCENGALVNLLRSPKCNIRLAQQLGFCRDVASGMAYMEQCGRLHRDLAARNILVASDMRCLIADFGLSAADDSSSLLLASNGADDEDVEHGSADHRRRSVWSRLWRPSPRNGRKPLGSAGPDNRLGINSLQASPLVSSADMYRTHDAEESERSSQGEQGTAEDGPTAVPLRWCALETLVDNVCTIQSDVWSYGVLMHEIFNRGQTPYRQLTNAQVLEAVKAGVRLEKPSNCPKKVYEIMHACWQVDPQDRPRFARLQDTFEMMLDALDDVDVAQLGRLDIASIISHPDDAHGDDNQYVNDGNYVTPGSPDSPSTRRLYVPVEQEDAAGFAATHIGNYFRPGGRAAGIGELLSDPHAPPPEILESLADVTVQGRRRRAAAAAAQRHQRHQRHQRARAAPLLPGALQRRSSDSQTTDNDTAELDELSAVATAAAAGTGQVGSHHRPQSCPLGSSEASNLACGTPDDSSSNSGSGISVEVANKGAGEGGGEEDEEEEGEAGLYRRSNSSGQLYPQVRLGKRKTDCLPHVHVRAPEAGGGSLSIHSMASRNADGVACDYDAEADDDDDDEDSDGQDVQTNTAAQAVICTHDDGMFRNNPRLVMQRDLEDEGGWQAEEDLCAGDTSRSHAVLAPRDTPALNYLRFDGDHVTFEMDI